MAAVVAYVAEYFGAEALAAFAASTAGAFVINTAVLVAASAAYQQKQRAKARDAARDAAQDRQVMIRSAIQPQPVIYGRAKLSGTIAYAQSTGSLGQYLHIVLVYSGHQCDAIETVYFNDVALPTPDANGFIQSGPFAKHSVHPGSAATQAASIVLSPAPVPGSIIVTRSDYENAQIMGVALGVQLTEGVDYTVSGSTITFAAGAGPFYYINYQYDDVQSKVRIKTHLGAAGQTADADLVAESGGKWTTAHVGNGLCYQYFRLEADNDVFGQIGVPNISAVIRGKRIFDPRVGITVWSDNAALCIRDWLRDQNLGLGCTAAEVPDSEVIVAANICDEDMSTGDYYIVAVQDGIALGDENGNLIGGI